MKTTIRLSTLVILLMALTGCEKIIMNTVYSSIENDPKRFFDTIQSAQIELRKKSQENQEEEQKESLEKEFKSPKKPVVQSNRVIFGNAKAQITIVEYSDFRCPYCARGSDTMKQLFKEYGKKIRLIYKHLPFKSLSEPGARYYEAIGMQSDAKARKFHDLIFKNQSQFKDEAFLKKMTRKVGANLAKVMKDKDGAAVTKIIESDRAEARKFNFTGTPGYLVNGVSVRGAYPLAHFKKIIDRHLKK